MKKILSVEFLFLIIIFLFAVFSTNGKTIAWGLLPLFYGFNISTKNSLPKLSLQSLIIFLGLFTLLFLINFLAVYSFDNKELKVPHPDFHYYLKVASFFNQTGQENIYTAKNLLINKLNFQTPYRFFDTWLLALLIRILPFTNLQVLQLFYFPTLYFLVVYSLYKNINIKSINLKFVVVLGFIFLFGDYFTSIIINKNQISEICVTSYPKLAIFFTLFIYFFSNQIKNNSSKHSSILFLALMPILIQTAFPLYLFIYAYIIFYFKYFLENKKILFSIIISTLYFTFFYVYNFYLSKEVFEIGQFQLVKTSYEYFYRILSISYNLFKTKLFLFTIITLILFFCSNKSERKNIIFLNLYSVLIVFSGLLVYAFFPSSPNSYQLMTNFIFPVIIVMQFFIWINTLNNINSKKVYLNYTFYFGFTLLGIYNQYNSMGFFNVKDVFTNKNDKNFVLKTCSKLKKVKNKIGLTYWSKENYKRNLSEHFDQYGTNFLIKLGAEYDIVCLSNYNDNSETYSNKASKHNRMIDIFRRLEKNTNKNIEFNFYNKFHFQYLFSDLSKNSLPSFLKKDIISFDFDSKSKIYCYILK